MLNTYSYDPAIAAASALEVIKAGQFDEIHIDLALPGAASFIEALAEASWFDATLMAPTVVRSADSTGVGAITAPMVKLGWDVRVVRFFAQAAAAA